MSVVGFRGQATKAIVSHIWSLGDSILSFGMSPTVGCERGSMAWESPDPLCWGRK